MKPILPRRLSGGQHTKKPSAQAAQADALLRLLVAFVLIVIFFSILLARFFYLQVTQHNEFSGQASSNRITLIPTPPAKSSISTAFLWPKTIQSFRSKLFPAASKVRWKMSLKH